MVDHEKDQRPDPDAILERIHAERPNSKGKLKIFLGYAAGVGKTYSMLDDAKEQQKSGVDVVIGYIEPHSRPETMKLIEGFPALPVKIVQHKTLQLKEFDLDAALARKPGLILVDELAHSNPEGMRNKKRFQDIDELLNAGIDVYTTVNIQHLESLNDVIHNITKVHVKETIPDYVFDNADKVEIIDFIPDELLRRFAEGKIYRPERAEAALNNFFVKDNLRLLREIALRKAADRISQDNLSEKRLSEKMSGNKLLVCISSSPSAENCIRWAARTAEAFHIPWVAVYVEDVKQRHFSEIDKKNLENNLDMAKRLGAEVVTLFGDDTAVAVAEYAKLSGITNIVVGKSRNKRTLTSIFETDFEDKLISLLPSHEIHIIPSGIATKIYKRPMGRQISKHIYISWTDSLKTMGLIITATLVSAGLRMIGISDQNMIMVYILSVLVVSRVTSGYGYGVAASLLSVLTYNFFFTLPYYTFDAIEPGYPVTFFIMLMAALFTSALTVRIRKQAHLSIEREHRTGVLYEINKKLLSTRGLDKIVDLTNNYISNLFERSVIFYTQDPKDQSVGTMLQSPSDVDGQFLLSNDERAVAHWVFINQKNAGAGTDTLRGAEASYMPIISQGNMLGVIGMSCSKGILDYNNRIFLQMIVSLVALALERQYLSDEQRRIVINSEKEKMRSNLLRAISHDLRTPLTGILGASSTILENGERLDHEMHDKLIANIRDDSQWLIRMVENLLFVTRIDEGTMNVVKTQEAAEEVVAEAISRIRQRFPDSRISVKVPDELLMVPMDGTLIEQVLINLMENAIKHSIEDSMVQVEVWKKGQQALFSVADNGEGISEQDFPFLFEGNIPNSSRSPDSSRGMGIGLSICMSIIKAHNGKMEAHNKEDGGAIFTFALPLEEGK